MEFTTHKDIDSGSDEDSSSFEGDKSSSDDEVNKKKRIPLCRNKIIYRYFVRR